MEITGILTELSSQTGDKTEKLNIEVANKCLSKPELLKQIANGLQSKGTKLQADCIEVFTKVAEQRPEFIIPYFDLLPTLLDSKAGKVRWEAMHTISLIANLVPDKVNPLLPLLYNIIHTDKGTIIRDYAVDTFGDYAKASTESAKQSFTYLKESLKEWEGKHANRALAGLGNVAIQVPELKEEIREIAESYINHPKGVVKKEAKRVLKII